MAMQDTVLSVGIPSVTTSTTRRLVSPIDGWIERIIAVRGEDFSAPEDVNITTQDGTTEITLPTAGAAGDVDLFEFDPEALPVTAHTLISVVNDGTPTQITPLNIFLVIRRL